MKLKEIMTKEVENIQDDESLQKAAEKMLHKDIGALPVFEKDKLVGLITDRDIVIRATAKGLSPQKTKVKTVMTPCAECCREDQSVEEGAKLMEDKKIRRLLILDDQSRLAGIVSMGDLAEKVHDPRLVDEVLETVCRP